MGQKAKHVRLLTGSQDLYGSAALDQVAANAQRLAARLDGANLAARVQSGGVLTSRESIQRAVADAAADPSCVGVIAWMHTFSPAKMWIGGLGALAVPLAHLHTQAEDALPWATIDMDFMNLHQAAHGDREFAHAATRLGVTRKTIVGSVGDPAVHAQLDNWIRAAIGWAEGRATRLVRFGDNMRSVAVTDGDRVEAERVFGVAEANWGVNDLVAAVDQAEDAAVDALIAEYEDRYDLVPELRRDGPRHPALRYAARQEIGLRAFLEAEGATAFTTNFQDLGALRQLPGLAVQRLTEDGYGFGAEGDWKTALLVRLAKVMGAGLPGGASLMEDYTYHLVPGEEKILGAHMLEVCPSLTQTRPRAEIHPLSIGDRSDPVRLVFTADPGPGVLVGLADLGDRFRLTANTIELVAPDEPLPRLPVARAVWRPEPDFATAAECWLTAGAPHHTCLSTALGEAVWRDYAAIAGVELASIATGTTAPGFADELRWNQAYYHLARGL